MDRVNLWKSQAGTKLIVKTLNHEYLIEVQNCEIITIQGGHYFPTPEKVYFRGSTHHNPSCVIHPGKIIVDYSMEIIKEDGKIISTSKVQSVEYGP